MFANHWAAVADENWDFEFSKNKIRSCNKNRGLYINFQKTNGLVQITGRFYYDGIKIIANKNELILPQGGKFSNNLIYNSNVAFKVTGDSKRATFEIADGSISGGGINMGNCVFLN